MKTTIFKLRNLAIFAVFFALILSTNACRKSDDDPTPPDNSDQVDVYVAGSELVGSKDRATIWKNGTATHLTDGSKNATATSVFVQGNDVYAAGGEGKEGDITAKVWKNGTLLYTLFNSSNDADVTSVFVQGNDVYVAGFVNNGSRNVAKIWKNGTATNLSDGSKSADAKSVFVQDDTVYVVGEDDDIAKLWKIKGGHITTTNLTTDNSYFACGNSVFVQSNDVYIVGYYGYRPILWINGIEISLSSHGEAISVFVKDNITYVAGSENNGSKNIAKVWKIKDGKIIENQSYSNGREHASANSIFIQGNDVYVVGYDNGISKVWKNGIATNLITAEESYLNSIYVVKK